MAFIDEAKFFVKAGDGGNGCVSFRREKCIPRGGPDGGDGGDGGSIILKASSRLKSLVDFRYRSHFLAENGKSGQGKKMHGRNGKDTTMHVPVGSIIKDAETGAVLIDLITEQDEFVVARGGAGGNGNTRYATSTNRAPRKAGSGQPGEEKWLKIELKLLADVGLIGLPNAGKSTLLSRLSAANPKVAPYPFTTIEPQLGVLHLEYQDSCIIADIPGLIENAHQGAGLGIKFLRHIERTRLLVWVIDASGSEESPENQFSMLARELNGYSKVLVERAKIIVLNKTDLIDPEELAVVAHYFEKEGCAVVPTAALDGTGIGQLKNVINEMLLKQL